jgi:tyrosine aminotransferase
VYNHLKSVRGLRVSMPKGAMYMMIGINFDEFPAFETSVQFMEQLIRDQNVHTFATEYFHMPGFVRIVLTAPPDVMHEMCLRMIEFCVAHTSK